MNDSDLIQRNQITMMRFMAELADRFGCALHADSLRQDASETEAYVDGKLGKTPTLPSMAEAVKAMQDNPFPNDLGPDDLVDKACRRAGAEERRDD